MAEAWVEEVLRREPPVTTWRPSLPGRANWTVLNSPQVNSRY
ncbi:MULTISPECIES: hypothetical protein [unclassified Streptomyces]|nr:hypothetical protein [Streptomyces sp. DASNCL29]